jgi:hypothetical protein
LKSSATATPLFGQIVNASLALTCDREVCGLVMRNFKRLSHFLAIPVAMIGFVLMAAQAGGFVLRKEPHLRIDGSASCQPRIFESERTVPVSLRPPKYRSGCDPVFLRAQAPI